MGRGTRHCPGTRISSVYQVEQGVGDLARKIVPPPCRVLSGSNVSQRKARRAGREATMESALNVVKKYYEAFDAHRDGWQELVADDITFVAPIQKADGKQEFVALTAQFLRFHKQTRVLRRFEEGDSVCSIFEFVLDTPSGDPLTCQVAEWARVDRGRISELRIFYDPRGFAKAFGL
jgi:ketosteroid isomerase-like protein